MTENQVFRIVCVIGLLSAFSIRVFHRVRPRDTWAAHSGHQGLERLVLIVAFVGILVVPLSYVFGNTLTFADYRLPIWTVWVGALVFLAALCLLWRTHVDLGRNWSQTLELREGHELVTTGIYRRIRHPMYAAFWLWGIAQALLLPNWIAGFSCLGAFAPLYFLRVPREERMMLDRFGPEYQAYMNRTGRVLPRWPWRTVAP